MSVSSDVARRGAIGVVGAAVVSGAMLFGALPAAHASAAPTSAGVAMTASGDEHHQPDVTGAAAGYGSPLPEHWWHHRHWWHHWWWWW
jgi:hypothetical protein